MCCILYQNYKNGGCQGRLCNILEVFFPNCAGKTRKVAIMTAAPAHTKNVFLPIGFRGVQLEGLQDLSVLVQIIGFATHSLLQ